MIHHSNSFITTKSFSLRVILIDLYKVPPYVPTGHTLCIHSINLFCRHSTPFVACRRYVLQALAGTSISPIKTSGILNIWLFTFFFFFFGFGKNKAYGFTGELNLGCIELEKCSSSCCFTKSIAQWLQQKSRHLSLCYLFYV